MPECFNADRMAFMMQVVQINDYQKQRFVERMIEAMFNTISGKKIAVLGFAFKKVRHQLLTSLCSAVQPCLPCLSCHGLSRSVT